MPILGIFRHLDVTSRPALKLFWDDHLHMVGFDLLVFHHRGFSLLVYGDFVSRKMDRLDGIFRTRSQP